MIDYTHYIKAKSVIDTYLSRKRDLAGTAKKQHFFVRLSLCQGYGHILDDLRLKKSLFAFTTQDLSKRLGMSWDELWDESMKDDERGHKGEIKKINDENIKFYFGMTGIIDETCILLRNGMDLPEGVDKKLTRRNLMRMIDIANNDAIMRDLEGVTYVNGIGGIMCLKMMNNSMVPIGWDTIRDCFRKIWKYYLEVCGSGKWKKGKKSMHNYIYGLTHCVINLSNFYTNLNNVQNSEHFMDEVIHTKDLLCNVVDSQKRDNYQIFNDDTLAELLLTISICGGKDYAERLPALDALSLRFDSSKLMFREHKYDNIKEEIIQNEHTNILYVLNILYA